MRPHDQIMRYRSDNQARCYALVARSNNNMVDSVLFGIIENGTSNIPASYSSKTGLGESDPRSDRVSGI